jgi:hypothetical protein
MLSIPHVQVELQNILRYRYTVHLQIREIIDREGTGSSPQNRRDAFG